MTTYEILALTICAAVPIGALAFMLFVTRNDRREAYEALKRLGVR